MADLTERTTPLRRPRRWPDLAERLVGYAVLPGDPPNLVWGKRLFTAAMWASLFTSSLSAYQLYVTAAAWGALALCIPILTAAYSLIAMRVRPSSYPGVMHVVAGGTLATTSTLIVLLGGVSQAGGNTAWSTLTIIGTVAIFADRRALTWLTLFVVATVAAALVAQRVEPLYVLPNREYFSLFNLILVTVFVVLVLYYFVIQSNRLYRQSEDLLRNVLPASIVERLRTSDERIAEDYASASILFADVTGFTPLASRLRPEEVVDMLNQVFTLFDDLVDSRRLEKIKTIGDEYMVAAGVPDARDDHATAICDLALAMQKALVGHVFAGHSLSMRIGVASGPVTAGIVGRTKFAYDLWGETVNLASRMQSTGIPGAVQLTPTTRELVAGTFTCERRGEVDVKGVGMVETWLLVGPVSA